MLEVQLEDFEEFYKEKINYQFFKKIKVSRKIISDIRNNLIGIKGAIPGPPKGLVIIKPPRP